MSNPRVRIAVAVAAVVMIVVVGVVAAGGSGDDGPTGPAHTKLILERYLAPTGQLELLVSMEDAELNTLETTGGETSVLLRCFNRSGAENVREKAEWPLVEEAGYPIPHLHQPLRPKVLNAVRDCRLTGHGIAFEGRSAGPVPDAP
jgi:hypothetical protein